MNRESMILKFDECKQCEKRTRDIYNCIHICDKPLVALKEFNKYKNLEEQGKLLKLPCAVGDIIYQCMVVGIDDTKKPKYKVVKAKVFKFSLDSFTLCFWTQTADEKKHQSVMPLSAFGKTVFLTCEAAEVAVEEIMNIRP